MNARESALADLAAARTAYDDSTRTSWFAPSEVANRLVAAADHVAKVAGGPRAIELTDVPQCDPGTPMPQVLGDGQSVWLSYFLGGDGFFTDRAVLRFSGVDSVSFGGPNDEALHGHSLWGKGLAFYAFHEVIGSRWVATRERENSIHEHHRPVRFARLRHFVFTFHDETFECLADGYAVDDDRGLREVLRGWDGNDARLESGS